MLEANSAFATAIQVCAESSSSEFDPLLAEASYAIGSFLAESGQRADAAQEFERVVKRYRASCQDDTLYFVAASWRELVRHDFADGCATLGMERFEDLVACLQRSVHPEVRTQVALAFQDIVTLLNRAGRHAEAITIGKRCRKEFRTHGDSRIRAVLSGIVVQHALAASRSNSLPLALRVARMFISKWGDVKVGASETDLALAYDIVVHCLISFNRRIEAQYYFVDAFEALERNTSADVLLARDRMLCAVAEP